MILFCKRTLDAYNDKTTRLFTAGMPYEFIPVDNRYTQVTMKEHNLIGYIKKDDEGFKRWISKDFKKDFFVECK